MIQGTTVAEIVASVRNLVDAGVLAPTAELPTVRGLAADLGVNRNTVASAYALLVQAGVAETAGRRGTRIRPIPELPRDLDPDTSRRLRGDDLVDLASGNPDPALLPDLGDVVPGAGYRQVLYGDDPLDPELLDWARVHFAPLLPAAHDIAVTHGAVDAVDRVLAAYLTRGDAVALEDPCFLASIGVLRVNGYDVVPVATDELGMVPASLEVALARGVRAVVCTVRALNPTGASLSAERAAELRAVLGRHPHVLVIEDDHFSGVASTTYHRVTPEDCPRWALVRSVSKFLGPDLRLALVAADPETVQRLETRLAAGATWVSRILQRTALHLLRDARVQGQLAAASDIYRERRDLLIREVRRRGFNLPVAPTDGVNVWIGLDRPAAPVVATLAQAGWAVTDGSTYALAPDPPPAIRVTASRLTPTQAEAFADALARACGAAVL
ncbi:MAG: aminotransferase class I/II-fold pyridoxal phosphate-dependent enzyme [Actinomycetales bacterium]|nr:aminotransferase class I/II-fold pyridoxal phosphate-dependent enzyme [Actinomycetales bacterium]